MAKETSRLTPQHQHWHKNLPLREEAVQGKMELQDLAMEISEQRLVVSREANLIRGAFIVMAAIALLLFGLFISFLFVATYKEFQSTETYDYQYRWYFLMLSMVACYMMVHSVTLCLRTDLRVPIHNPIRFNRSTGQVQAYEGGYSWWKAFGKWPSTVIKQFDWSCVQAEVQRQSGYNGKIYVVYYYLVLCVCKPGTLEVIDRVILSKGCDEAAVWNYLRTYMAYGPSRLPKTEIRRQDLSFVRSLFIYIPWWEPNAQGAKKWREHPVWGVFATLFSIPFSPFILAGGLGHYLASRFAPEPDWEHTPVVRVGAGEGAEAAETTP
jgi:hypothetical protein